MSSRAANKEQQAAFVAVLTPSGHATRLVMAPMTKREVCERKLKEMDGGSNRTFDDAEGDGDSKSRKQLFDGHERSQRMRL